MKTLRTGYENTRTLLNQKLGRCPKCMGSSILGSVLSWLAVAGCYMLWPNRIALTLGLIVACAFTILMATHVVVHMMRVAALRRYLATAQPEPTSAEPTMPRREFAISVARSGYLFASAALLSLPMFQRAALAAKGGKGGGGGGASLPWCNYTFAAFDSLICGGIAGCPQPICVPSSILGGICPSVVLCTESGCSVYLCGGSQDSSCIGTGLKHGATCAGAALPDQSCSQC